MSFYYNYPYRNTESLKKLVFYLRCNKTLVVKITNVSVFNQYLSIIRWVFSNKIKSNLHLEMYFAYLQQSNNLHFYWIVKKVSKNSTKGLFLSVSEIQFPNTHLKKNCLRAATSFSEKRKGSENSIKLDNLSCSFE